MRGSIRRRGRHLRGFSIVLLRALRG